MSGQRDSRHVRRIRASMRPTHWILVVLGVALVVIGVLEILAEGPVWIYLVHVAAGVASAGLGVSWRWIKPGIVVLGALFVALYVVESAAPESVGDNPDPSTNASLILTGFVLLALMVALMLPTKRSGQEEVRKENGTGG